MLKDQQRVIGNPKYQLYNGEIITTTGTEREERMARSWQTLLACELEGMDGNNA